jgi:ABC-type Zn uptake system ZnuABC Zn-binding protein ZnuA
LRIGSYQCGTPQLERTHWRMIRICGKKRRQCVIVGTLNIRNAFAAADPSNAGNVQHQCRQLHRALETADAQLFSALASIPPANRVLVTNHDAMAISLRATLSIAGVVLPGGTTGQEPDPKSKWQQ